MIYSKPIVDDTAATLMLPCRQAFVLVLNDLNHAVRVFINVH